MQKSNPLITLLSEPAPTLLQLLKMSVAELFALSHFRRATIELARAAQDTHPALTAELAEFIKDQEVICTNAETVLQVASEESIRKSILKTLSEEIFSLPEDQRAARIQVLAERQKIPAPELQAHVAALQTKANEATPATGK